MDSDKPALNTDRELWRKVPGDYYSPRIHATEGDGIGINVGGTVIVLPVELWHRAGENYLQQRHLDERLGERIVQPKGTCESFAHKHALHTKNNFCTDWRDLHFRRTDTRFTMPPCGRKPHSSAAKRPKRRGFVEKGIYAAIIV